MGPLFIVRPRGSADIQTSSHNGQKSTGTPLTIGEACLKGILSPRPVSREWDYRTQLARDVASVSGKNISTQIVYNHLAETRLYAKHPKWCVPLAASSRKHRIKHQLSHHKLKTSVVGTTRIGELWFQQDGATCHRDRAIIDLLKDTFGDRLISRFGPVNWPPRSCDLTPLDYFLWAYVKSLVYADKPQMLDHLEDNIRRVIADIRPQMLEKVIENWTSRLDYIRASRGSPMPEIIFKM
ncbi:putative transposable element [Trichonephila clavipes]|uniref:Putative transposable element n=1 Tax=Trichonephila clavipes TaxID=2585209 RepID=A0A8X6R6S3_TRICX|nr:putative transposable element [Trichonephila clavipes]